MPVRQYPENPLQFFLDYEWTAYEIPNAWDHVRLLEKGEQGTMEEPWLTEGQYEHGIYLKGVYEQPEIKWLWERKMPHDIFHDGRGLTSIRLFNVRDIAEFKKAFPPATKDASPQMEFKVVLPG